MFMGSVASSFGKMVCMKVSSLSQTLEICQVNHSHHENLFLNLALCRECLLQASPVEIAVGFKLTKMGRYTSEPF